VLKPETLLLAMFTALSASACGQTLMMTNTISGGDSTGASFSQQMQSPANSVPPYSLGGPSDGNSTKIGGVTDEGGKFIGVVGEAASVLDNDIDSKGHIHGFVYAKGDADGPANATVNYVANASATLSAVWQDTLTIISNTLPAGSPVSIRLDVVVASTVSTGTGPYNLADLSFSAGLNGLGIDLSNNSQNAINGTQTASKTGSAIVGQRLALSEELNLVATGWSSFWDASGPHTSTVDAEDNALYVEVLTPGATYVSTSGISYLPPHK